MFYLREEWSPTWTDLQDVEEKKRGAGTRTRTRKKEEMQLRSTTAYPSGEDNSEIIRRIPSLP